MEIKTFEGRLQEQYDGLADFRKSGYCRSIIED